MHTEEHFKVSGTYAVHLSFNNLPQFSPFEKSDLGMKSKAKNKNTL